MSIESVMLSSHLIFRYPLLLCLQSFPAAGSFPTSWLFTSNGHSVEASASVLPMNIQGWSPLGLTGLISLQSKWLSRVFSSTTTRKHPFFGTQPSLGSNPHICTPLLEKPYFWLYRLVGKVMSLLFNMLCRFTIVFLPRSKHLFTSWLQSLSTVIWDPKKIKSVTASTFSPFICHEVMGLSLHSFTELCKPLRHDKAMAHEGDTQNAFPWT